MPPPAQAEVLWICNPTTPPASSGAVDQLNRCCSGSTWVILDEAFLPLVPDGEAQSLIPLVAEHTIWW